MGRFNEPIMFACTDAAAREALKEEVKKKLGLALGDYTTRLQNAELKSQVIVLCPRQKIEGQSGTGAYIVDAVCEFLGFDKAEMKTRDAHGFVVNPTSGVVQLLRWGGNGEARSTERDFDDEDFEENFPEESAKNYGWTEFDHTNERGWTALWSRGRWVWADPARAIGPGL